MNSILMLSTLLALFQIIPYVQPLMFNGGELMTKQAETLDTDEPYLWQMAALAARQMSDKRMKFKLMTLSMAEKTDSTYRLRVTLKRLNLEDSFKKNDILYCTVEVIEDEQKQWQMDNFGCSLPAMVRSREPTPTRSTILSNELEEYEEPSLRSNILRKYSKPMTNTIMTQDDNEGDLLAEESNQSFQTGPAAVDQQKPKSLFFYRPNQPEPIRYMPYLFQQPQQPRQPFYQIFY